MHRRAHAVGLGTSNKGPRSGGVASEGACIPLEEMSRAKSRIKEFIIENTPVVMCRGLEDLGHPNVHLKLENLQVTSSFKIRGAANALCQTAASSRKPGRTIITASAGNHGQAVALVAQELGLKATIVVPETTPMVKIAKIREHGPELVLHGASFDVAELYAKKLAKVRGLEYLSAYNDPRVIAGHGTIGLEVLAQLGDVDRIIVPVGGGGLISGISSAVKQLHPRIEIIGVESEASPAMYKSIAAGKLINVSVKDSIADGLSGNIEPGSISFGITKRYVDRMVLVTEESIRKAIRLLWEKDGQVVEASGAVAIAPIVEMPNRFEGKRTIAVITGGNIDESRFKSIVASGK